MRSSTHPKFKIGDQVRILASGLSGKVTEIDPQQSAYAVEINGNPESLLLCTEDEPRLLSSTFVPNLANRRLMLHIALVVAACVLDGWCALMIFSLIFRGTGRTPGCGCLSIVVVGAVVATILAFRF